LTPVHPGFLDFARHCDFRLLLCAPYRAQTKGKVERFIRYLRHSFYVPLASRLAQESLIVDRETANLTVKRWLREVANARVRHHRRGPGRTIGQGKKCSCSRSRRFMLVAAYARSKTKPAAAPIVGLQHPLSLYDAFAGGTG
jgi:hypothetical protein